MAKYGIPYMGSKSQIADEIIANLPHGNRFVDLFGGGFAISHCALLSYKWKKVLYNDINPLLIPLLRDAIDGKYSYSRFTPEWVTREEFHMKKDSDGYVKWIWSFGNDGSSYLYGKDIEDIKHKGHDFCVYGNPITEPYIDIENTNDINSRRLELNQYCAEDGLFPCPQLSKIEHLERLERLQALEGLARQDRLEMTCKDYREYKYEPGDVVYCDIPYQNGYGKDDYGSKFDFGAFYEWAISRPFPVYFSSYKLGGIVWERDKTVLKDPASRQCRTEVLYCVDDDFIPPQRPIQHPLF